MHIDGRPVRSCVTPLSTVGTRAITTIEAIGNTPAGRKVQKAWLDSEVVQCSYCQSGQIMSAARLASTPRPRTRISTPPCPETSAAAEPTCAFARPSRGLPVRPGRS